MTDKLPHTHKIDEMLKKGDLLDAAVEHNKIVKQEFAKAKAGETINLSDLMAAKETLDQAIVHTPPWKRPEQPEIVSRRTRRFTVTTPIIVEATGLGEAASQAVEDAIRREIEDLIGSSDEQQRVIITGHGEITLQEWEAE
jgi:hypothetical protein